MKEYQFVIQEMQKTGLVNDFTWVEVKLRRRFTPEENQRNGCIIERSHQERNIGGACLSAALEFLITALSEDEMENWRVYWEAAGVFYNTGRSEYFKENFVVLVTKEGSCDV